MDRNDLPSDRGDNRHAHSADSLGRVGPRHGRVLGGLTTVNHAAPADRRADVLSSFYVIVYCGVGFPVMGVGFLLLYFWSGMTLRRLAAALGTWILSMPASSLALIVSGSISVGNSKTREVGTRSCSCCR